MRYKGTGNGGVREQIRQARRQQSLSQAQLAARSGVSRVTVARVETGAGRDVRVETLRRLCAALDLEVAAVPSRADRLQERLLVRERETVLRLERRLAHARLAARLLAAGPEALGMLRTARAAVDRWERDRLCSRHYIVRWRSMLRGPVLRAARSLLEPGDWQDALFQNTPWSFALERPPS